MHSSKVSLVPVRYTCLPPHGYGSVLSGYKYLGVGHFVSCTQTVHAQLSVKCVSQVLYFFMQVYVRLTERLGLQDHLMVLTVMLTKICTNLKVFGCAEDVIQDTLTLFAVSFPGIHHYLPCLSLWEMCTA